MAPEYSPPFALSVPYFFRSSPAARLGFPAATFVPLTTPKRFGRQASKWLIGDELLLPSLGSWNVIEVQLLVGSAPDCTDWDDDDVTSLAVAINAGKGFVCK